MNHQWFSGDPSTPSRRKSSVGIPVRMTRGQGVPAAGNTKRFSTTIVHARRFLTAVVSSRLSEPTSIRITEGRQSERMEGSHK